MKKRIFAIMLSVVMILAMQPFSVQAEDKTAELTNVVTTVSQNGAVIDESTNLDSMVPIVVSISFDVPVEGDDPTPANPVHKGDTASFELSSGFILLSGGNIALNMGIINVGHVNFTTDPVTRMVTAVVTFDGDDAVFDGTYNTVECSFSASFEYDDSGSAGDEGDHEITILEKTYIITVPPAEITYNVTKSGVADLANKCIEWTVTLTATQGAHIVDLNGYKFSDDLTNVGGYIAGSFTVDGAAATPSVSGSVLTYTFPADSDSPETVKFKTEIPDSKYYVNTAQSVTNKAQLFDSSDTLMQEGQITVNFTPRWIAKTGAAGNQGSSGDYNPLNRTITWTITANQLEAILNNVIITDILQGGLTLQSASWQAWNGSAWGTAAPITPNGSGEYAIGDIDSQILLTIVASVPDDVYTASITNYVNSATIRWDGLTGPGIGSGNITVPIGYNAITKSGSANTASRTVHWTVNVDTRSQAIPDLKVYDLLVYNTSINLSTVSGIPSGISASDLTPRYNLKYIDGTFAGTGLSVTVIPIMQGSVRVADLLEITGFSVTAPNTFTFDSLVTNPAVFATNASTQVWNTATLFSAFTKLNAASAQVTYNSRMLYKNMLTRTAAQNPAANVNSAPAAVAEGFDYTGQSVVFRLNVNANGLNVSGAETASGTALGTVTVTDTLPAGWVFEEITSGHMYLIFEGTAQSNGRVLASDTVADDVAGLSANVSGSTAAFTFSTLDAPYVILVKARPASETAAGYFNENKTTTVRNNLTYNTQNWNPGVTSYQDVSIRSTILGKTIDVPQAGILRWTVEYHPNEIEHTGARIEDTLPAGIDLRTDSSGALLLSGGNITLNEMRLNADGTYTVGSQVTLTPGGNISYDNATRVLSFTIPDSQKAYRLTYLTDVTGGTGQVTNNVHLYGETSTEEEGGASYVITVSDGQASLQRNGWIDIFKQDENRAPLAGAEFTVFAQDGTTVIRQGVTGADGQVRFKVIPDGEYIVRETAAPAGYTLENVNHILVVTTAGSVVISSIDGKTGEDSNVVTVQDFPEGTVGSLTISKTVAGNAGDTTKKFDFTITLTGAEGTYNYTKNGVPCGTIESGDTVSLSGGQYITILGLPKDTPYTVTEADYSADGYVTVSTGSAGVVAADTTQTAAFTNTRDVSQPDTGDKSPLTLLITLLVVSFAGGIITLLVKKSKYSKK